MTRNKIYLGVLLASLFCVIAWASYSMLNVGKKEEIHQVSVIVNNSNSDRWISFRQGLEQAAKDYNVDINYVSTDLLSSAKEEIDIMNHEIAGGAEGIIVQMISSDEYIGEMESMSSRIALMLLESDIEPEDIYEFTGPDNPELGRAVAQAIKSDFGAELANKKIGIFYGNQNMLSMQQRLKALEECLKEEKANVIWRKEGMNDADSEWLQNIGDTDIIIALGNDETEQVVDYIQTANDENWEGSLYGIGCSEKAVYYLDKGLIHTLVVPNEYAMGYQSLGAIAGQLKYHLSEAKGSRVDFLVINKDNLYEEENQKVLFPIVQ